MLYGQRGQGTGRMPGFGDNPDDADDLDDDVPGDGMFTDEHDRRGRQVRGEPRRRTPSRSPALRRLVEALDDATAEPTADRGARGAMLHLLAGIAWDPQIRGFLAVLVGVVVLMGSVYLLLGTNLGARLGLPRRAQRPLRLVHDHGRSPGGSTAPSGCSARPRSWEVEEVVYHERRPPTTPGSPIADARERRTILDTSRAAAARGAPASSTRTTLAELAARRSSRPLGGWRLLAGVEPGLR